MADARPEFAPSPRPPVPMSVALVSNRRAAIELLAGTRRANEGRFRLFFAGSPRLFNWLFQPRMPPCAEEDGR